MGVGVGLGVGMWGSEERTSYIAKADARKVLSSARGMGGGGGVVRVRGVGR